MKDRLDWYIEALKNESELTKEGKEEIAWHLEFLKSLMNAISKEMEKIEGLK